MKTPVGFTRHVKLLEGSNIPMNCPSNVSVTLYPLLLVNPNFLGDVVSLLGPPPSLKFTITTAALPDGEIGLVQTYRELP